MGVVINIFANRRWSQAGGVPQMGAEGVAWATTGTRWMIAAIMLIFVAALTPGFRRSRLRRKGKRVQLEVGTGTAISNIAEWGGFNVTSSSPPGSPSRPTLSMAIRCR